MPYIPKKDEEYTELCPDCHKLFTFVGNGYDAPVCCPACQVTWAARLQFVPMEDEEDEQ